MSGNFEEFCFWCEQDIDKEGHHHLCDEVRDLKQQIESLQSRNRVLLETCKGVKEMLESGRPEIEAFAVDELWNAIHREMKARDQ